MSRLRTAALNGGLGFLLAFVAGALDRNLRAGLQAGVLVGTTLGVATWLVYGSPKATTTRDERVTIPSRG